MGFKDNLTKQGIGAAVIGLSGGIDSAVVAALACRALDPKKIFGVSLPTRFTSPESVELARTIAQNLGINYLELDADAPYSSAAASLKHAFPEREFCLTDENLQSRARGVLLMALTTEPDVHRLLGTDRCVVINTGNKSEAATGYFTLYGDGIGAFGPLGDLLKARVYLLADEFQGQIPEQVIKRPPSAELRPGQTDEASLVPYSQLDAVLGAFLEAGRPEECLHDDLADVLEGQNLARARMTLPRILQMVKNSEFKRRYLPYVLNVTQRNNWPGRPG
jgi:NAD+ synthase (glutamine-hydrolysing)